MGLTHQKRSKEIVERINGMSWNCSFFRWKLPEADCDCKPAYVDRRSEEYEIVCKASSGIAEVNRLELRQGEIEASFAQEAFRDPLIRL